MDGQVLVKLANMWQRRAGKLDAGVLPPGVVLRGDAKHTAAEAYRLAAFELEELLRSGGSEQAISADRVYFHPSMEEDVGDASAAESDD